MNKTRDCEIIYEEPPKKSWFVKILDPIIDEQGRESRRIQLFFPAAPTMGRDIYFHAIGSMGTRNYLSVEDSVKLTIKYCLFILDAHYNQPVPVCKVTDTNRAGIETDVIIYFYECPHAFVLPKIYDAKPEPEPELCEIIRNKPPKPEMEIHVSKPKRSWEWANRMRRKLTIRDGENIEFWIYTDFGFEIYKDKLETFDSVKIEFNYCKVKMNGESKDVCYISETDTSGAKTQVIVYYGGSAGAYALEVPQIVTADHDIVASDIVASD